MHSVIVFLIGMLVGAIIGFATLINISIMLSRKGKDYEDHNFWSDFS